jgi:hypothetical protein
MYCHGRRRDDGPCSRIHAMPALYGASRMRAAVVVNAGVVLLAVTMTLFDRYGRGPEDVRRFIRAFGPSTCISSALTIAAAAGHSAGGYIADQKRADDVATKTSGDLGRR